jgi:hypothetical protein
MTKMTIIPDSCGCRLSSFAANPHFIAFVFAINFVAPRPSGRTRVLVAGIEAYRNFGFHSSTSPQI